MKPQTDHNVYFFLRSNKMTIFNDADAAIHGQDYPLAHELFEKAVRHYYGLNELDREAQESFVVANLGLAFSKSFILLNTPISSEDFIQAEKEILDLMDKALKFYQVKHLYLPGPHDANNKEASNKEKKLLSEIKEKITYFKHHTHNNLRKIHWSVANALWNKIVTDKQQRVIQPDVIMPFFYEQVDIYNKILAHISSCYNYTNIELDRFINGMDDIHRIQKKKAEMSQSLNQFCYEYSEIMKNLKNLQSNPLSSPQETQAKRKYVELQDESQPYIATPEESKHDVEASEIQLPSSTCSERNLPVCRERKRVIYSLPKKRSTDLETTSKAVLTPENTLPPKGLLATLSLICSTEIERSAENKSSTDSAANAFVDSLLAP